MIHLVTGAARAGKSSFALRQAEAVPGPIHFLATAQGLDDDMRNRILRHQAERGERYHTVEVPLNLPSSLLALPAGGAIVVDCLTMWVTNLLFADVSDQAMQTHFSELGQALKATGRPTWVVSNEVGWGIVPADALSRRYRDQLGRCNQAIATQATHVSLLVAGLPMVVK